MNLVSSSISLRLVSLPLTWRGRLVAGHRTIPLNGDAMDALKGEGLIFSARPCIEPLESSDK